MSGTAQPIRLTSPGPIASAFLRSRAFICVIIGPVGSGKTMAMLQKGLRNGAMQGGKVDAQGVLRRRARFGVLRESYPSLDANTLPSWFRIMPKDYGKWSGRAPYTHRFERVLKRDAAGRPIDVLDMEYEFRAIGEMGVEAATRGWEVNAVGVDEADLQPPDLVSYLSGRVGRFSELNAGGVVDPQILLSLNAPYTDNHIYKLAIDKELGALDTPELREALQGRPLVETFIQPGGLEPGAENLPNLPGGRGYYILQAAANAHRPGYVDRMIHNKFVPMQHGLPVNPGFSFGEHVRSLEWDRRRKLIVGIDQGLFAAAACCQRTVMGELRTLAECVNTNEEGESLVKIGATAFGKKLRTLLTERFPGIRPELLRVVADPAAFKADDNPEDDRDWLLSFQKGLGFRVHKAKSNKPSLRNQAIWDAMGERGGYAIDPTCRHLIKGHLGGYRYQKADMAGGETRGHLEIANTIFTHIADAEQYAALEGEHVIDDIRGRERRDARRVVRNDSDFNELEGR